MRRFLFLLLCGCGGSSSGPLTIDGVLLEHTFFFDQQTAPGRPRTVDVHLATSEVCDSREPALILAAGGTNEDVTGTWTVGGSGADLTRAQWRAADPSNSELGVSGSVVVTDYTAESKVSGTFEVTFERVGAVSGSFEATRLCMR